MGGWSVLAVSVCLRAGIGTVVCVGVLSAGGTRTGIVTWDATWQVMGE